MDAEIAPIQNPVRPEQVALMPISVDFLTAFLHGKHGWVVSDAPADLTVITIHHDYQRTGLFALCHSQRFHWVDPRDVIPMLPPLTFYGCGSQEDYEALRWIKRFTGIWEDWTMGLWT